MSIDFDPVPLRPRRRRIDPIVVGVVVVAVALGAAVLKPWETRQQAAVMPGPSGLLAASPSVPPTPRASQRRAPTTGPLQPAWAEIAPEVTPHELLGVRTIVAEPGATGRPEGTTFGEGWVPAAEVGGVDTVRVANEDRAIVAMGPTFPTDAGAADARIWRVHAGGVLEWVDARPIEPEDPDGSFLFVRTGRGGAPYTWWPAGTYRIDVLGAGGIHRIDVDIPGRFGLVPAPDAMVIPVVGVVPAAGSDLSSIRPGLFAIADGFGVALAATQTRPLDAAARLERPRRVRCRGRGDSLPADGQRSRRDARAQRRRRGRLAGAAVAGRRRRCASGPRGRRRGPQRADPGCPVRGARLGAVAGRRVCHHGALARWPRHAHRHLARGAPSRPGLTALGYAAGMPRPLSRKVPLAELHCHLGGAVTPAIMWGIAHSQGIKLPTKDYWEFRDMITVSPRRNRSFDGYLQLFHWTELIQSSPLAVERSVYEVVGGAYRKNNVTTMELRFNPMKRNRGGEQDLDHIIAAAVRGMDRAKLEYPIRPGLLFCLDRAFPFELNEIIVEKAIGWRDRGVVGIDIAGPESATFRVADYRRLFRRARQYGLGLTVHTGESGPVEEVARVVELLEPDRIGHGVKAAYDPRAMAMIRDRGIVLEICPTSNLNTRVVSGWDEFRWIFDTFRRNDVRFTINTDGPEMLKTYIRDEMAQLGRLGILSVADQEEVAATSLAASFVPNVSDVPAPRLEPATRIAVEREEA